MKTQNYSINSLIRAAHMATVSLLCALLFASAAMATPPHLSVNGVRNTSIIAKNRLNATVRVLEEERYRFSDSSTDTWWNGLRSDNAIGFNGGALDIPTYSPYRMMALICELYSSTNFNALTFTGYKFRVGLNTTRTMPRTGYLSCFANDNPLLFGDNSGSISLRTKRLH